MENPWHASASIIFPWKFTQNAKMRNRQLSLCVALHKARPPPFQPPTHSYCKWKIENGKWQLQLQQRLQLRSCQAVACKTLVMRADCETNNVLSPARSRWEVTDRGRGWHKLWSRRVTWLAPRPDPCGKTGKRCQLQSATIDCKSHAPTANASCHAPSRTHSHLLKYR